MKMYLLLHGGYSYNVAGPFLSHDEAVLARTKLGKTVERSRILEIGAGPGGIAVEGRARLTDGRWALPSQAHERIEAAV